MSDIRPQLNRRVVTPAGDYFECEIHGYAGLLPCWHEKSRGSVGDRVKITKCLYPCGAGDIQAHGSLPYAHVGEILWIGYLRGAGHDVERDVVGYAVECPWSNVIGEPEKIIWALEVGEPTDGEYEKVFSRRGE
jgi:hypothetical protein